MNFRPLFMLAAMEAAALASLSVFFSEHLETGLYVVGVSLLSWLSNRFLEIDGVTRPLSAWAEIGAVTPQHLRGRLRDGWGVRAAVFTPPGIKRERAAELWPDSPKVSSVST